MDQTIVAQGTKSISSSELSHLLCTNDAPSELEAAWLRTAIENMLGSKTQLGLECGQIEEQLRLCRRALAPIRRVPSELLSEIFEWSILESTEYGRGTGRILLNIGLVCRDWRQASTQQWSRLDVYLGFPSLPSSIPCEGIRSWFANAGNARKSLTLSRCSFKDSGRDCGCDTGRCLWSDLPALIASITLLDRLSLSFDSRSCLFTFLDGVTAHGSSLQADAPVFSWHSLRSLSLVIHDAYQRTEPSSGPSNKYKNLLSRLPHNLGTLELDLGVLPQGEASPSADIPSGLFTSLTTLAIGIWDPPAILSMLRHCANIHTLSLSYRYSSPIGTEPTEQVILPTVRNLSLKLIPREWKLLGLLRFPALRSLTMIEDADWEVKEAAGATLDVLNLFANGGSSTLQHLVLRRICVSASTLYSILYCLPSLAFLDLDNVSFNAPKLLELQLKRFNDEVAVQVLRPLRQLHVNDVDYNLEPVPLLRCIRELRREGTITAVDTLRVKFIADSTDRCDIWRESVCQYLATELEDAFRVQIMVEVR